MQPILPPTKRELRHALAQGENLGWKRPFALVLADLHKPVPEDYLASRTLKGERIIYLEWHTINMILDYISPGWQFQIRENQIGDRAVITAKLTLLCHEGKFSRESTGSDNTDDEWFGGPLPDAEAQSLRRVAARFGLGLYLYDSSVARYYKKHFSGNNGSGKQPNLPQFSSGTKNQNGDF